MFDLPRLQAVHKHTCTAVIFLASHGHRQVIACAVQSGVTVPCQWLLESYHDITHCLLDQYCTCGYVWYARARVKPDDLSARGPGGADSGRTYTYRNGEAQAPTQHTNHRGIEPCLHAISISGYVFGLPSTALHFQFDSCQCQLCVGRVKQPASRT